MNADDLRAGQAPLKARYKTEPEAALITLAAEGTPEARRVRFGARAASVGGQATRLNRAVAKRPSI